MKFYRLSMLFWILTLYEIKAMYICTFERFYYYVFSLEKVLEVDKQYNFYFQIKIL